MNAAQQILHTKRPVLAVFYTENCGPCRVQKPIVDRIEREYTGIVKVLHINAGIETDLVRQYEIFSVPCTLFLKQGKLIFQYPGFLPYESLRDLIEKYL